MNLGPLSLVFADGTPLPAWLGEEVRRNTRVRIDRFRRDAVVRLVRPYCLQRPPPAVDRGSCGSWSYKSRRRLIFLGNNCGVEWQSLLTLTFPEDWPRDGAVCAVLLANFIRSVLRFWPEAMYLWVREFQERGAPHWHILWTLKGTGRRMKYRRKPGAKGPPPLGWVSLHKWGSRRWQESIGPWGTSKGYRAGIRWEELRSAEGGAAYLAAYASKPEQKQVPDDFENPGRFWSPSNDVPRPRADDSVEVTLGEYLAAVDGPVASEDGYLFGVLHDGRERTHRFFPGQGQQSLDVLPAWDL